MSEKSVEVKSVTFAKLVNIGNYENERFEITVSPVSEKATPDAMFRYAHLEVTKAIESLRQTKAVRKIG